MEALEICRPDFVPCPRQAGTMKIIRNLKMTNNVCLAEEFMADGGLGRTID